MPRKLLIFSLAVLALTVWNATGYHQGDEHFQILEFAAYKLGLSPAEALPWEFTEQMRPALQPLIAYLTYRGLEIFGDVNPFVVAGLLRFFSAALFLFVTWRLYIRYAPVFVTKRGKWWLAALLLFSWCNVYAGVRFSSEWWSGALFTLGFLAYPMPDQSITGALPRVQSKDGGTKRALLAGLLFGLSFEFRYQMALAVVGFVAWALFVAKPNWKHLTSLVLGGLTTVGLATLVDYWFYQEWVFAPWNYLEQNLIEGKAAGYGTQPWYAYLKYIFERGVPPLSLVYLAAIAYFCCWRYRRDPITWSFLVFFVVHSMIGRKDIRFLFPLLPFLPVITAVMLRDIRQAKGEFYLRSGWRKWVVGLAVFLNCALLASVTVRSMNENHGLLRYVYRHYEGGVTILTDGQHLYNLSDLTIRFYQPNEGVTFVHGEDRSWPACPTKTCLYSERTKTPLTPPTGKLVYTNRPLPDSGIDPFGLVSGHRWWYLYEVE